MSLLHISVVSPEVWPDGNPCLLKAELCVFITSFLDLWMSFDFRGSYRHLSNKWQFSEYSSVYILSFQVTPCSMTWINYLKIFIRQKSPVINMFWLLGLPPQTNPSSKLSICFCESCRVSTIYIGSNRPVFVKNKIRRLILI